MSDHKQVILLTRLKLGAVFHNLFLINKTTLAIICFNMLSTGIKVVDKKLCNQLLIQKNVSGQVPSIRNSSGYKHLMSFPLHFEVKLLGHRHFHHHTRPLTCHTPCKPECCSAVQQNHTTNYWSQHGAADGQ